MKKITYLILSVLAVFCGACSEDVGDYTVRGEALSSFEAQTPENSYTLTVNKETPEATLNFQWSASESGLNSLVTYKLQVDRAEGDFSAPLYTFISDEEGKANTATLSYSQLLEIAGKVTSLEGIYNLSWRVEASNSSGVKKYTLPLTLKIIIPEIGISPLELKSPGDNQVIRLNKITKPQEKVTFEWNKSTVSDGSAITYRLIASKAGDHFEKPIICSEATSDTSISFTTSDLVKLFNTAGYTEIDMLLEWKVTALAGTAEFSSPVYQLALSVEDIPSLYLVGDATEAEWNTSKGIALNKISDGIFSGIVKLKADKSWKVIANNGENTWDPAWGTNDNPANPMQGTLDGAGGAPNIPSPATEGAYKITLNFITMTYQVEILPSYTNLYMVGDGCSAGWSPENGISLWKTGDYKFEIYASLNQGGIKFLPTNTGWDGDWGMKPGTPNTLLQEGEDNVNITEADYYHITIDFENLSYNLLTVNSWGIIGDATIGGWNTETPMDYDANSGLWKLDNVTFTDGTFKFRANNDWSLNYGTGEQDQVLNENGGNIPVQAGTYSLTLDLTKYPYSYTLTAK